MTEETARKNPPALSVDRPRATFVDYVAIARPDHWIKHIFIVPGIVLAYLLHAPTDLSHIPLAILMGFVSAASIASANYVINEWFDASFDVHHPTKSQRPAVVKSMSGGMVSLEYFLLAGFGLAVAWLISILFFLTSVAFIISGIIYNLRPFRTKDIVYFDVLTESINNPLRLLLGWTIVDSSTLPPSSLFLIFWMGGAFLMSVKRLAEYRNIVATNGVDVLHLYRTSFRSYNERRLLISSFLYVQLSAFFLAIFIIKYRIEYIFALPFFAVLFSEYFRVGLKRHSRAQAPEKLFREKGLIATLAVVIILLILLTYVDIPILNVFVDQRYLSISFPE